MKSVAAFTLAPVCDSEGVWVTKDRVAETLHGLADRGWAVTNVAVESGPLSFLQCPLRADIEVVSIPARSGPMVRAAPRMIKAANNSDVILSFMPTVRNAAVLLLYGKRCVMYSGISWAEMAGLPRWKRRLELIAGGRAVSVVAAGDQLSHLFSETAEHVEAAVPIVPPEVARRLQADAEPPLVAPRDTLRVLFVGSLGKRKGIDALLAAVADLPEVECRIVGPVEDDATADRLRTASRECKRITLSDYLLWPDLRSLYAWADVLVLPSAAEGFPRVLYEATAFDVALLVSPVSGIPKRLTHERDALFIPPGDVRAISAGLERLRADAGLRASLIASARRSLRPVFREPSAYDQFDRLLSAIVDGRSPIHD